MKEVVGMKSQDRSRMSLASKRIGEVLFGSKLYGMIKSSLGLSRARVETGFPARSTIVDAENFQVRAECAKVQAETELRMVQTSL
jgi:hypothetical protein